MRNLRLFRWLIDRALKGGKKKTEDKDLSKGNKGVFKGGYDKPAKESEK